MKFGQHPLRAGSVPEKVESVWLNEIPKGLAGPQQWELLSTAGYKVASNLPEWTLIYTNPSHTYPHPLVQSIHPIPQSLSKAVLNDCLHILLGKHVDTCAYIRALLRENVPCVYQRQTSLQAPGGRWALGSLRVFPNGNYDFPTALIAFRAECACWDGENWFPLRGYNWLCGNGKLIIYWSGK